MNKRLVSLLLVLTFTLGSVLALASCDNNEEETTGSDVETTEGTTEEVTEAPTAAPTDASTEAPTESETETDTVTESDTQAVTETETATETGTETETETETETAGAEECFHPYDATQAGHWKPACDKCGKGVGKVQSHEYEEYVEDEGDLLVYALKCTICKYIAYEQEVPYEINSFYSAGELAYTDSTGDLVGNFGYEAGVGYASYSSEKGGSSWIIVLSNGEVEDPSGRYLVMKVRMAKSQSSFAASIKSVGADAKVDMSFTGLKSGWVTIIVDITKAIGEGKDKQGNLTKLGYQPDMSGEYYLGDFRLSVKAGIGESFDIGYVMFCDTIEDAEGFAKNDGSGAIYVYDDIINSAPDAEEKVCVDENGNPIKHEYIVNDDGTHTLKETCYQCGLAAVDHEPHIYAQMIIDGDFTYACGACGDLQFGININKYISAAEIATTACTYYKVTKNGLLTDSDGGFEYASFSGQSTTAQILFARNSSVSSPAEEAGAFDVGKGNYFILKMRTTHPGVSFAIRYGTYNNGEATFRFPTSVSTANEWAVYVVDLSAVIPQFYVPDAAGNYRLTQYYYHIGGTDFTPDVTYDIAYTTFVDSWEEVAAFVDEETIINVSASNTGSIVKTEDRACIGDHSYNVTEKDGKYLVACGSCGHVLNEYEISGADAFYPAEILINMGTMNGTANITVGHDDDGTGFVHIDNMVTNGPSGGNWMGWNLIGDSTGVLVGKYMIIKLRIGQNGLGQNFFKFYTGTQQRVDSEGQGISVKVSEDGKWHTIVVDLTERIGDPSKYMVAGVGGKYSIKTIQLRPFSNAQTVVQADDWMDISYVAFCDDLDDLAGIISEETYEWSVSAENSEIRNTADGDGVDDGNEGGASTPDADACAHTLASETASGTTYTYTCSKCSETTSITLPESVTSFYSAKEIANGGKVYYNVNGGGQSSLMMDDLGFARTTGTNGKASQILWMRCQVDFNGATGDLEYTDSVGKAEYLVIRARTNNPSQDLSICISTTGKNGDEDGSKGNGTNGYPDTTGYTSIDIPFSATELDGWATYVINLKEVIPEYYVAVNEEYVIDTFYFHFETFEAAATVDVSYVAFVDGSWAEIDELVEDTQAVQITEANGSYKKVNVADGSEAVAD